MTDCKKVREQINFYLDNETTSEVSRFIQSHLNICVPCQKLFAQEQYLEQKLVKIISSPGLDDEKIWSNAINSIRGKAQKAGRFRIYNLRYLVPVASAALVMIVLGMLFIFIPGSENSLLADTVQEHQLFLKTSGLDRQLTVKTDSLDTVTKYFSEEYGFSISGCECGILQCGTNIKGGRMCSLSNTPAVHVLLNYREIPISLFVLSSKDIDAFPDAKSHLKQCHEIYYTKFKGFNCALVRICGNFLCAVGDVEPAVLKQLLSDTEADDKKCKCKECE